MKSPLRQVFVGMGSNLGDRFGTLNAAIDQLRLSPAVDTVEVSSVYESDPVGLVDQPLFLNLVAGLETRLSPETLLDVLLGLERDFGRVREVRWGPRTLDLDLLVYEGESRSTPALELPHPRMHERPFVVIPLLEVLESSALFGRRWVALRNSLIVSRTSAGVRRFHP